MAVKKTTKKAPARSEKKTPVVAQAIPPIDSSKRSPIVIGIVIIFILVLLYSLKGLFIAAMVNNRPISRLAVIRELEKHSGRQAIDSLITKQLILEEARKRNVKVSEKEVDDEIKNIKKNVEAQGQKFDQLLQSQGLTEEDLESQIFISKTVEKLFKNDLKVSDEEINKFIEANKAAIPEGANQEEVKKNARTQLEQQKLSQKAQELIANLKKSAKIEYYVKDLSPQ